MYLYVLSPYHNLANTQFDAVLAEYQERAPSFVLLWAAQVKYALGLLKPSLELYQRALDKLWEEGKSVPYDVQIAYEKVVQEEGQGH